MSKQSTFKLCLVIALTITAASAFGAATTISGPLQMGGGTYSPSNKVTITYDSGPTATNAATYAAHSKHSAGDREVATNNSDPKMWWKNVGVSAVVSSATSTDTFSSTNWTSM